MTTTTTSSAPAPDGPAGLEGRDDVELLRAVPCLRTTGTHYTLISTRGFHCNAWRSAGTVHRGGVTHRIDLVLKVSKRLCLPREARILARDHRRLTAELDEIIPPAEFVVTEVGGEPGVLVLAEPCVPWFDLANPGNEPEALPLLRNTRRAIDQLARFTRAARRWLDEEDRLIDLCGVENLVLDRNQVVRYLDSFNVFLYIDLLDNFGDADPDLVARVTVAEQRLEYLEGLVAAARR